VGDTLPFSYSVSFNPRDPVFGDFGNVSGSGASWRTLSGSSLVGIELPLTPVSGTVFGGLALFVSFRPRGSNAIPDTGRYDIGPDLEQYEGTAFIQDPTRRWTVLTPGFLEILASDSTALTGRFALRGLRIVTGATSDTFAATVVGDLQARRTGP